MKVIKLPQPIPVTVMAVVEDLSQIAIGLVNGTVLLIRGDLKQTKQFILQPEGQSPVTGMAFKQSSTTIVLFVVTSDNVSTYHTGGKEIYKEELDSAFGSGIGCAVLSDEEDLIVARKEAVYFYEVEGRGPCFAFEGEKKLLHWFRGYLVVVGHDPNNLKFNSLTIYDLKNKFIAYSENRFQNISHIVTEWGAIFIFTGDGKIFHLEEKDTQTKLETLFKKNLYSVAINLAQSQNLDYASIIDIFRKYGDHLYLKGDYDGAISQYIRTIGKLEPSYVIRKFLDAQRIHNLTSYLQTLHEKGLANADHTTLLFNCYTKLKDVKKLDEFIKTESDMSFDIDTAIKACRQSQYYEHALYLAKRHNQHDQYLKILLEDLKGFQQALQYIATLDFFEAEKTLKKYGKVLVTSLPQQTTDLLEKLCIDYVPTLPPNPTPTTLTNTSSSSSKTSTPTTMSPVLSPKEELFSRSTPITVTATTSNNDIKVKAVPDEFIHIYVNQPEWLIKFIEFIISKGQASNLLYNTLLELYMRDETTIVQLINTSNTNNSNSTTNNNNSTIIENRSNEEVKITKRQLTYEEQNNRRKEALKLLTNSQSKYDDDYALVLCKLHSFREGLLYLYEKLQVFNEIIEYYMENNEYDLIIQSCKTYGSKDSNLWVHALTYFANKKEECTKEITEILTNIDRNNLLPPLLVIQILSQKSTATLALIKDYITRRLNTENQYINEDSKQIKNYKDETKKMRSEIQELKTTAKIFQLNKCTYCNVALDLPAVHFLCMHSFHQRCLGENESECPNCAPQNKKIIEIKRSLQENVGQHDQFFRKLEGSADGFNVVSEYFSKGIFNSLPTAPDTPSSKQKPKINF